MSKIYTANNGKVYSNSYNNTGSTEEDNNYKATSKTYKPTNAAAGESSSANYENAVKTGAVTNSNTSSGPGATVTKVTPAAEDPTEEEPTGGKSGVSDDQVKGDSVVDTKSTYDDSALREQIANLSAQYQQQQQYYSELMSALYDKISNQDDAYTKLQDAYDTSLEEQKKAIQAGVDQSVNTLTNQKDSVNSSYEDTMRQLYIDKMNAQKNIGQQMAAAGQTGGQAESTLLGLNNSYAENLRNSEQAKSSALSELETAIANAKLSGSAETANAIAENGVNSANAYITAMNNYLNNGMNYASMLNSDNQQTYSNAYEKAMTLISSGVMPDSSTLANAGLTESEANNLIAKVNASSSSGSSKTYSDEAKQILLNAYLNGDTSVASALEEAYGVPISAISSAYGTNSGSGTSSASVKSEVSKMKYYLKSQNATEEQIKDSVNDYLNTQYTAGNISGADYAKYSM